MSSINDALPRAETETVLNEIDSACGRTQAVASAAVSLQDEAQLGLSPICLSSREWNPDWARLIFTEDSPEVAGVEQFRSLRSRVYQLHAKKAIQTILIGSALEGEGKTFVAANFALALAKQEDRKVLLVDADLRKPSLHEWFGAPSEPGLSELLAGSAHLAEVVQSGSVPNLWLLPGGAPVANAAELLGNNRMADVLAGLTPVFDWIIVDSSPVLPFADAAIVSRACDAVLLVAKAEFSPHDAVQKALQRFRDVRVLGMVLNGAWEASHQAYRYAKNGHGKGSPGSDVSTVTDGQFSLDGALRSFRAGNHGNAPTGRERRLYLRHPAAIPVKVTFDNAVVQQYVTIDVSENGLALRAERQLELGTSVRVNFTVPGTKTQVEANGEIVWSHQDGRCGIRMASRTLKAAESSTSASVTGAKP